MKSQFPGASPHPHLCPISFEQKNNFYIMTKYFVVPALFAFILVFSSCEEALSILINDDTVCGEDVYTGYQPVSPDAFEMTVALTPQTTLVFVNAQQEEMILTVKEVRDQKTVMFYKNLCFNLSNNDSQDEYCDAQTLEYIFQDPQHDAEMRYNWYVDNSGEMIYDAFNVSINVKNSSLGGDNTWVANPRAQQLPEDLTRPKEYERVVGDTTMLGRPFQNVTYHNWGYNKGKGFFFQKGVGVVAMWVENKAFWVLDRVE